VAACVLAMSLVITVGPLVGVLPSQGETVALKPGPGSRAGADLMGRIAAPR
jgi:hypothetical protein